MILIVKMFSHHRITQHLTRMWSSKDVCHHPKSSKYPNSRLNRFHRHHCWPVACITQWSTNVKCRWMVTKALGWAPPIPSHTNQSSALPPPPSQGPLVPPIPGPHHISIINMASFASPPSYLQLMSAFPCWLRPRVSATCSQVVGGRGNYLDISIFGFLGSCVLFITIFTLVSVSSEKFLDLFNEGTSGPLQ